MLLKHSYLCAEAWVRRRGEKKALCLPWCSPSCCLQRASLPFSPCSSLIHPLKIQLGNSSANGLRMISWELCLPNNLYTPRGRQNCSEWPGCSHALSPRICERDAICLCYVIRHSWASKRETDWQCESDQIPRALKITVLFRLMGEGKGKVVSPSKRRTPPSIAD